MAIEASARAAAAHAGHTFAPGARVFDHQSGLDGVVLSSAIVHGTETPAAAAAGAPALGLFNLAAPTVAEVVTVQLDGAGQVERAAAELVGLPEGLETIPVDFVPPTKGAL